MNTYKIYYTNNPNQLEIDFLSSIELGTALSVTVEGQDENQAVYAFLQQSEDAWGIINGLSEAEAIQWRLNYSGPLDPTHRKVTRI